MNNIWDGISRVDVLHLEEFFLRADAIEQEALDKEEQFKRDFDNHEEQYLNSFDD